MRFLRGALLGCALFLSTTAAAEVPPWRPAPPSDAIEFGSIRLEPGFAAAPPPGRWDVTFTASQFNVWVHTWHTFATHRDRGIFRQDVTGEELRSIESQFPRDTAWHIDVEGWRADLVATYGLPRGWAASVKVPWIEIGAPNWDQLGETFHESLDVETLERDVFRRGSTLVYIKSRNNERIVEAREELDGGAFGDVTLALGVPLRSAARHEQRLVLSAEVPTGDEERLQGSGGIDANLSWFSIWRQGRRNVTAAAGYSFLDPRGSFLGFERARHLGHLALGIDQPLTPRLLGTATVRIDSSPLSAIAGSYLSNPSTWYRLGLVWDAGRAGWLGFEFGDELFPQTGAEADWSFHLAWGVSLRRGDVAHR